MAASLSALASILVAVFAAPLVLGCYVVLQRLEPPGRLVWLGLLTGLLGLGLAAGLLGLVLLILA
jgi:hypothetical protein